MTVRFYSSADVGAPVMEQDTPASIINVLKACLVTGYGSKAAAGWTNPFNSGANIAVFRPPAGNRRFLRVSSIPFATKSMYSVFTVVECRGYENMTAVTTGTGPFPTTAQRDGGGCEVAFGYSANITPGYSVNDWVIVATDKLMHFFWHTHQPPAEGNWRDNSYGSNISFGDFTSYKAGDVYNTLLQTSSGPKDGLSNSYPLGGVYQMTYKQVGTYPHYSECYVPRDHGQTGTSKKLALVGDGAQFSHWSGTGEAMQPYPNPIDGSIILSNVRISDYSGTGVIRGILPGVHNLVTDRSTIAHGDTWSGIGEYAGKTFFAFDGHVQQGMYVLETSDTW